MVRWFDEVRLASHPIAEIGAAFYIREMLGNDCRVNKWDLREVFGEGCETYLENLRRAGMLQVEECGQQLSLRIVAPGDRKRERCRMIARKKRNLKGNGR